MPYVHRRVPAEHYCTNGVNGGEEIAVLGENAGMHAPGADQGLDHRGAGELDRLSVATTGRAGGGFVVAGSGMLR